ncbi:hypothetical protein IFM89_024877 [Coptis chinensis]|uniref:Transmembrane 9 superfamily member n=1 Tax=Coptis chinensis TaxID=261450 RepID=A0A835LJB0_9MAGN|nr:hypothetical protein IFM89_024877 [Coptis chinensis]
MTKEEIIFIALVSFLLVISLQPVKASKYNHHYTVGEIVPFFVNKIGPLNNPSETYQYFDLPFCLPDRVIEETETLGEVLNGDRLTNSLYEIRFREDKILESICNKSLNREEVEKFRDAVKNDFYFQMYYDDLPLWGFIGKVEEELWNHPETGRCYQLFKHVEFNILYNEDRVIEIIALSDPNSSVDITENANTNVEFTYSVSWNATSIQFANRMRKYLRSSLLPEQQQAHWFSIINSVVIVVLLAGLSSTLFIQNLRNELRKYSDEDEETEKEEVGWKHLHGDVFRYPPNISLFCAIMGSGTQLLTLFCFLFVLAFLGVIYPYNRGALYTSFVVVYALTSFIAGYTAASFRTKLAGTGQEVVYKKCVSDWCPLPWPAVFTFAVLNTVAISYRATAALPFGTIAALFLIWTVVVIPFLCAGGLIGRLYSSDFQAPCATRRMPLEIPPLPWYRKMPTQIFLGGLLPFSAIFIELHYLYASMWGHKIFIVYSILFIVFIILILITVILSIGFTYFQLSVEDHEWWWSSLLRGGSTSVFMYSYCFIFYGRSSMSGFLQLSFFFGYNACICYAFFLMLGTIGFYASLLFVRHIYRVVKLE